MKQYKKMLRTLDPRKNTVVATNSINSKLTTVNILRKRGILLN